MIFKKIQGCICLQKFSTEGYSVTVAEKSLNSWRPNRSSPVNASTSTTDETLKQNSQPVRCSVESGGSLVFLTFSSAFLVDQVGITTYLGLKYS